MPHCTILYTPQVEQRVDLDQLCRAVAGTMLAIRDDAGRQVFPTGGTRVLAYPAAHHAVADGAGSYDFVYVNIRMAAGRSAAVHQTIGDAVFATVQSCFADAFDESLLGLTVQIDESMAQVYDAKHSTLHPLFRS